MATADFSQGTDGQFSIYLAVADSSILPDDWTKYAQFSLTVINQVNCQYSVQKGTSHTFNGNESDRGFASFMSLSDLYDCRKRFFVNDTLVIEAKLLFSDDFTRVPNGVGHQKQVVHFRLLQRPREDAFCLELSKLFSYDEIVQRVAHRLGLDDPQIIRLTLHNPVSQKPAPAPIGYNDSVQDIRIDYDQGLPIMYYEVLGTSTMEQNRPCAICMSAPKEGACVPCGHMLACMSCLSTIKDKMQGCPICRAEVQQVIRIYDV